MARSMLLPLALLLVNGCAGGSTGPGTLPRGATAGIYTTAEPQALASCIAAALGSTAQPQGARIVIASTRHPGLSYSIGPNRGGTVYPTQVAVMGTEGGTQEAARVNGCVGANASG